MAFKIFLHTPDRSACSFYRGTLPFRHCYSYLSRNDVYLASETRPIDEEEFDCYIFNRLARPDFYYNYIAKLKRKLIMQTDDNILDIPDSNPIKRLLTAEDFVTTKLFMDRASKIACSTQPLADSINSPERTVVLPNLIDTCLFKNSKRTGEKPLKILWCGSESHHGDLQEIVEPIIKISEKYKDDVGIIFWGYFPSEFARFERVPGFHHAEVVSKYPNIYKGIWFDLKLYFDKLCQLEPDIAIIPLEDCKFNESKSNLKFLEMSMAGAATITSDLLPYEAIKHNETGIKVKTKNDWYNALVELIENKDFRLKLADNARQQVIEEFSWQCSKRKIWQEFFLNLKAT